MGVNSLPKTVTRQRRGCDLDPGPSALESSTLTTRLPSHPGGKGKDGRALDRVVFWADKMRSSDVEIVKYYREQFGFEHDRGLGSSYTYDFLASLSP